ncbi:MAG: hypothetical protein AUK48_02905 [Oscillatoriales cyanobacterium CG2_30_44_21]|nr:MAG: hypothetical protein AUK48_02905 [Oscillatoriales cyanobacterium CG2_30_44_21]
MNCPYIALRVWGSLQSNDPHTRTIKALKALQSNAFKAFIGLDLSAKRYKNQDCDRPAHSQSNKSR